VGILDIEDKKRLNYLPVFFVAAASMGTVLEATKGLEVLTNYMFAWMQPDNQLTGSASLGQVGSDWQLGGFAPTISLPPDFTQPEGLAGSSFGGGSGAGESLNTAALSVETSQQTLLTTPQRSAQS
jgi:hypothetical protein